MGQRLNIEIIAGDKVLANCYYHWSAYTSSAKFLTRQILLYLQKSRTKDPLLKAIRCLETTGAGLTTFELDDAKKLYPNKKFKKAVDRNKGLIAISQTGIKDTQRWEEGKVTIDILDKSLCFDVLWEYTLEEYKENFETSDISGIKVSDKNPFIYSFDDFRKNYDEIGKEPIRFGMCIYIAIE